MHVHTPETMLNDQFGTWDEYLAAVESNPDVKVIGVTDYLSISNYSKLRKYRLDGRLKNIDLLFPNIEFRLAPPTEKATAVNIHLLVSPDDPNHEIEILQALARLSWKFGPANYSCVPEQLTKFGYACDSSIVSERKALETGVNQFRVDFTSLRDWHNGEPWLLRNSLVAVSAGNDGLSAFRTDGAWAALRKEITRFSDIIFSGRPKEREFWLCEGTSEEQETAQSLGGPKPCLHGSDAHGLAKLFRPDEDRFCWIKADATFDGLRQVLYEPAERVHIGPSAPNYHDASRLIRSISISNSNGWFEDCEIPLNESLVSIIGQKGSGKSALAELIALASGSWTSGDSYNFLERAQGHLDGLHVELTWGDGSRSLIDVGDFAPENERVRYLSQRFVERLCAEDHLGSELIKEIESVIFSYIDPTDTLYASSFDELRSIRTEAIQQERAILSDTIEHLIREECALRANSEKLKEKEGKIKTLSEEEAGLIKQLPPPANAAEQKTQEALQQKRTQLIQVQQKVAGFKQQLQKILDVRTKIASFRMQMDRFHSEVKGLLSLAGLPIESFDTFRPQLSLDVEKPLSRREEELNNLVAITEGNPKDPKEGTIKRLELDIDVLSKQETDDKTRQDRVKNIQNRIAAINTEVERLRAEIVRIQGPEKERQKECRSERMETYIAFFSNLGLEEEILQNLYSNVKTRLSSSPVVSQEQPLEFSVRWDANMDQWLGEGADLFDQRKTIPFGDMEGIKTRHAAFSCLLGLPATRIRLDTLLTNFLQSSESLTILTIINT